MVIYVRAHASMQVSVFVCVCAYRMYYIQLILYCMQKFFIILENYFRNASFIFFAMSMYLILMDFQIFVQNLSFRKIKGHILCYFLTNNDL